jgi:hypothetical protein
MMLCCVVVDLNSLWKILWERGHITMTSKHLGIITALRFAGIQELHAGAAQDAAVDRPTVLLP